jgi:hypothetical protein
MSLQIGDWGVRRLDASGEAVAWADLIGVEVLTTDAGPYHEDLFWLLEGADGKGVAVSGGVAQETCLLRCRNDCLTSTTTPSFAPQPVWRTHAS